MGRDQHKDTDANMATVTTAIAPPATGQPFSIKLKHHDASYLPTSRFNTIDGLLKSHAAEPEQTPLICYPKEGAADFELHTGQDLDRFTDAAVQFYLANGIEPAVRSIEESSLQQRLTPLGSCRRESSRGSTTGTNNFRFRGINLRPEQVGLDSTVPVD